jgi:hypothetical protein
MRFRSGSHRCREVAIFEERTLVDSTGRQRKNNVRPIFKGYKTDRQIITTKTMKKTTIHYLKGLGAYAFAGALVGCVFWIAKGYAPAPHFLALGGGLFYAHRRWLKRINNSGDDVKIKQFI